MELIILNAGFGMFEIYVGIVSAQTRETTTINYGLGFLKSQAPYALHTLILTCDRLRFCCFYFTIFATLHVTVLNQVAKSFPMLFFIIANIDENIVQTL